MKYLSFDLDGTLLNCEKRIEPKTLDYLKKIQNRDSGLILISSRDFLHIHAYAEQLGMFTQKNGYIISNGGTVIYSLSNNKKYVLDRFNIDELREVLSVLLPVGTVTVYTSNITIAVKNYISRINTIKQRVKLILGKNGLNLDMKGVVHYSEKDPVSRCVLTGVSTKKHVENLIHILYKFSCIYNDHEFEVLPLGAGKYRALEWLAENKLIDLKKLIFFGDGENDLECIIKLQNSVAMKNATDAVLDVAKYVTPSDNNHEGIYNYLKEIKYE